MRTLEAENRELKAEGAKKGEFIEKLLKEADENHALMEEAINDIIEKSKHIYAEYKEALGIFRDEPEPLT